MARQSMTALITRVRGLIDDPAGQGAAFTDDEIQAALDDRRQEARYVKLLERESIAPGGTTTYLTFDAPVSAWEGGVTLTDSAYNTLTPATSDLPNGRWTFAAEPSMPVLLVGFTHDVYGAAADLLKAWAAKDADAFDVTADGVDLKRSQKAAMRQARADAYLAKARARSSQLVRTDEAECC